MEVEAGTMVPDLDPNSPHGLQELRVEGPWRPSPT